MLKEVKRCSKRSIYLFPFTFGVDFGHTKPPFVKSTEGGVSLNSNNSTNWDLPCQHFNGFILCSNEEHILTLIAFIDKVF